MQANPNAAANVLHDAQVRTAWSTRTLSDGTKLDVGRIDREQMFAITPTSTYAVVATRAGWRKCEDGSEARATVTNLKGIIPNAGGHTHPLGRKSDIVADLPGPEDGVMARATGKPAYVISRRRAFAIEAIGADNFIVRVVAGADFDRSEREKI